MTISPSPEPRKVDQLAPVWSFRSLEGKGEKEGRERMERLFQGCGGSQGCLGSDCRRDDPDLERRFCTSGLLGDERLHGGAD